MDWTGRMTAVIDYIEGNLADNINYTEAARIACCSPFYLQRLFIVITGMTLGEYIRKRRLTLAAAELNSGTARVIDIALKYGYESPDAFTRAFKNMHGMTPQASRQREVKLTACPRISFYIELKGGNDMDYRIIEKPAFPVAVTARQFTTAGEQNFIDIPRWWQEFLGSPDCAALTGLMGSKAGSITGSAMLGLCWGAVDDIDFTYGIGVELPEGASSGKFDRKDIPAMTWTVFDCTLENLQDVTKRIFSEWFPSTGYEHADAPELEVYLPENLMTKEMPCQIWIPVVKKK